MTEEIRRWIANIQQLADNKPNFTISLLLFLARFDANGEMEFEGEAA